LYLDFWVVTGDSWYLGYKTLAQPNQRCWKEEGSNQDKKQNRGFEVRWSKNSFVLKITFKI
jgi:hypothetical protein